MIKTNRSCNLFSSLFLAGTILVGSVTGASAQLTSPQQPPTINTFSGQNPDGCDGAQMSSALNSAGAYNYSQTYNTSYSLIHQPPSYFSCLQPILSAAQGLMNMFNGTGGLNIGSLLTTLAKAAVGAMIQQLATQACSALNSALAGSGINSGILSYLKPPGPTGH